MFDASLVKDLTEMMGKSLTFKDIEAVGGYLFKWTHPWFIVSAAERVQGRHVRRRES